MWPLHDPAREKRRLEGLEMLQREEQAEWIASVEERIAHVAVCPRTCDGGHGAWRLEQRDLHRARVAAWEDAARAAAAAAAAAVVGDDGDADGAGGDGGAENAEGSGGDGGAENAEGGGDEEGAEDAGGNGGDSECADISSVFSWTESSELDTWSDHDTLVAHVVGAVIDRCAGFARSFGKVCL